MPWGSTNNVGQQSNINAYGQGAYGAGAQGAAAGEKKPKKFVAINGIMQRNPAYDEYMARQNGQGMPTVKEQREQALALPVVANMDDFAAFNEASQQTGGQVRPMAFTTEQTIDMMQDEEFARNVGLDTDDTVEALGNIFAKYEIPMGLMNKLMLLSEYDKLEFIIDDSGSMNTPTNAVDKNGRLLKNDDGMPQTRWGEAKARLKELVEILAYVPTNDVSIVFFNRPNSVNLSRNGGETPEQFIHRANLDIDRAFNSEKCRYRTPALRVLQDSIQRGRGQSVSRYFLCDGEPDGKKFEVEQIKNLIKHRPDPKQNPITFMSCSEDDEEVEWMKQLEEVATYAAEFDDYESERNEVIGDQGVALPFNKGFYLVGSLVAAMCPEDLDAMDESRPFTKQTLDNLLGYETNDQEYRQYFDGFLAAQRAKQPQNANDRVEVAEARLKSSMNWQPHYDEFKQAPLASQIPVAQEFKRRLEEVNNGNLNAAVPPTSYQQRGGYGGYQSHGGGYNAGGYGNNAGYGNGGYNNGAQNGGGRKRGGVFGFGRRG